MPRFLYSTALAAALSLLAAPAAGAAPLSISYFGETATHPGLALGSEAPLWADTLFVAGRAGGWVHAGHAAAAFADVELLVRRPLIAGFDGEVALGLGVMQTFVGGTLYVPGTDRVLRPEFDWGRPALMPLVAFGLGHPMAGSDRLFGRLEAFGQYPVNTYVLPHFALVLGYTWGGR